MVAVDEPTVVRALHVVQDQGDDTRQAGDRAEQMQHVGDDCPGALGVGGGSFEAAQMDTNSMSIRDAAKLSAAW